PGHRGAGSEAEVTTDLLGNDGVVAGDDLDSDTERRETFEGRRGVKFGLIQEREVTDEGEVVFVGRGRSFHTRRGAGGDRDHPAAGGELGIEDVTSRLRH